MQPHARRTASALALALVAVATSTTIAVPPTPVTTYSTSPNVRLLANFPTGTGVGGKFSGNYYFHTAASDLNTSDGGLWVFDVAAPEQPRLVAHLPLPIWQNEDVDFSAKRKLLLISSDRGSLALGSTLFVYDIADPVKPTLKSTLKLTGGAGHIANCVLDCAYVYVTGASDGSVLVVDLRDPAAPTIVGSIETPAGAPTKIWRRGVVHDVHTDNYGNVWIAGSGGTAMYAPIKDPLKPRLLASMSKRDNANTNHLIHHNTMRLDREHVLVGEEAFNGCGADEPADYSDRQGGRFQVWRIDLKARRLRPVSLFQRRIPSVSSCSNHWFDLNPHRVAAATFYEGGVRFLDLRNPAKPRQVGWFRTSDGSAGQAQFVPGRPDLVYVSDYLRGVDVVKIDGGGRRASTQWEGDDSRIARTAKIEFVPSGTFGYACPVPMRRESASSAGTSR